MSYAKTIEMSSQSEQSFEDAVRKGIEKANATLKHVQGAWVKEQEVQMDEGRIKAFRVHMKVTFRLDE